MRNYRIHGPGGTKQGVIAVPEEVQGQVGRQVLHLPTSTGFEALWDKATERPVVLDKPPPQGIG